MHKSLSDLGVSCEARGIKRSTATAALATALLLLTLALWGQAAWIHAKAHVAQYLIASAWQRTLAQPHTIQLPWEWADTWPVLRLQWSAGNTDLYVLAGSTGNVLAFGPGVPFGSGRIGSGAVVVAGHRDTHFAFLEQLQQGSELRVQDVAGNWFTYRVSAIEIVDSTANLLQLDPTQDSLTLLTCFPFDTLAPGGPLRYVVTALRIS